MKQSVLVETKKHTLRDGYFRASTSYGEVGVYFSNDKRYTTLEISNQVFLRSDLKELIDFLTLVHDSMES